MGKFALSQLTAAVIFAVYGALPAFGENFPQPTNTEKSTSRSMSPEEVCKSASLPKGFELTAFAAEPDVQNPIAIATDERGRLWVAENYTWAGGDAGDFDTGHRDRIVILEDADGDGRHDKRTVFYDEAERLTSIQVGMGGVWLLCSPQLLFIPDKNRDDVPDGSPEVVLDGFDIEHATHTVANGLKWGPDGWLYGRQGILGTSQIGAPGANDENRLLLKTGVWRYHPTRRVCEVVMHGMTNPWGFDFDEFGEIFVTNTVIGHLWHVVPGARTERMSGQDFNPHAYQLISQVADHVHWNTAEVWDNVRKGVTDSTSAAGGGHAHTGLLIYQGDNWPEPYRGRLFMLNIHGRRINADILKRQTVGYEAEHGTDMCFISDPWFRGMDLISGSDGGVFIADWSDTGECHEWGGVHRTSGRIYKLTYGKPAVGESTNLAFASDVQLAQLQAHPNDWFTRRARLELQDRAATQKLDATEVRDQLLKLFAGSADPVIRMRAMWSLYLAECVDESWLIAQLQHPDEHVRVWAIRFLADAHGVSESHDWASIVEQLNLLARREQSGLVLLYLTSALQKLPLDMRWALGQVVATRTETAFAEDRTLAIMLWLAIEPYVSQHSDESLQLIAKTTFPLVRENIARRLALDIDEKPATVEKLLELAAHERSLSADILRGVAAAVNGRTHAPVAANWKNVYSSLMMSEYQNLRDDLNVIGVVFGDAEVLASLRRTLGDTDSSPETRNRALQLLLASRSRDLHTTLLRLVNDPDLALEAIRGLAKYDDPSVPATLLENFDGFTAPQKAAAVNTLASRAMYARALVQALEEKRLAPSQISPFQARQLMALGDSELSDRLRVLWGDARQTTDEKRKLIHDLRVTLTPKIAGSSVQNGKTLYGRSCASCHVLFGQGTKIGPDLTGSDRKNLEYLLENIIDPSAIVAAEFRVSSFIMADGRVLNGIILEQSESTITIDTPDGKQVIDRQDVDEISASDKSLMPDGTLQALSASELCDLLAYLMSN